MNNCISEAKVGGTNVCRDLERGETVQLSIVDNFLYVLNFCLEKDFKFFI